MSRRSGLRRLSRLNRSSLGSVALDADSNVIDENQALWWNELEDDSIVAPHLRRSSVARYSPTYLDPDSHLLTTQDSEEWWNHLETTSPLVQRDDARARRVQNPSNADAPIFNKEESSEDSEKEDAVKKRKFVLPFPKRRSQGGDRFLQALNDSSEAAESEPIHGRKSNLRSSTKAYLSHDEGTTQNLKRVRYSKTHTADNVTDTTLRGRAASSEDSEKNEGVRKRKIILPVRKRRSHGGETFLQALNDSSDTRESEPVTGRKSSLGGSAKSVLVSGERRNESPKPAKNSETPSAGNVTEAAIADKAILSEDSGNDDDVRKKKVALPVVVKRKSRGGDGFLEALNESSAIESEPVSGRKNSSGGSAKSLPPVNGEAAEFPTNAAENVTVAAVTDKFVLSEESEKDNGVPKKKIALPIFERRSRGGDAFLRALNESSETAESDPDPGRKSGLRSSGKSVLVSGERWNESPKPARNSKSPSAGNITEAATVDKAIPSEDSGNDDGVRKKKVALSIIKRKSRGGDGFLEALNESSPLESEPVSGRKSSLRLTAKLSVSNDERTTELSNRTKHFRTSSADSVAPKTDIPNRNTTAEEDDDDSGILKPRRLFQRNKSRNTKSNEFNEILNAESDKSNDHQKTVENDTPKILTEPKIRRISSSRNRNKTTPANKLSDVSADENARIFDRSTNSEDGKAARLLAFEGKQSLRSKKDRSFANAIDQSDENKNINNLMDFGIRGDAATPKAVFRNTHSYASVTPVQNKSNYETDSDVSSKIGLRKTRRQFPKNKRVSLPVDDLRNILEDDSTEVAGELSSDQQENRATKLPHSTEVQPVGRKRISTSIGLEDQEIDENLSERERSDRRESENRRVSSDHDVSKFAEAQSNVNAKNDSTSSEARVQKSRSTFLRSKRASSPVDRLKDTANNDTTTEVVTSLKSPRKEKSSQLHDANASGSVERENSLKSDSRKSDTPFTTRSTSVAQSTGSQAIEIDQLPSHLSARETSEPGVSQNNRKISTDDEMATPTVNVNDPQTPSFATGSPQPGTSRSNEDESSRGREALSSQDLLDKSKMREITKVMEELKRKELASMKDTKIDQYFKRTKEPGPSLPGLKARNTIKMNDKASQPKQKQTKKSPTRVNKAYIVNGKVYKRPKLPRPKKWATDRLYNHLWNHMEPRYKLHTRVRSEQFVKELAEVVTVVTRRKKYDNYKEVVDALIKDMAYLKIIKTRRDFYFFCQEFLPYDFRAKVVPMLLPGNVENIPFNPALVDVPILDNEEDSDTTDS